MNIPFLERKTWKWKPVIKLAVSVIFVMLVLWLAYLARDVAVIQNIISDFGYIGVFFIAVITGFNIIVPIPAVSFVPLFLESGLLFWPIVFTITVGVTLADSVGYIVGRIGREVAVTWGEMKAIKRLDRLRQKYYMAPLFLLFVYASLAPFPNEVLLLPLGFLGYHFKHLIVPVFAGNLIFTILFSTGIINLFTFV